MKLDEMIELAHAIKAAVEVTDPCALREAIEELQLGPSEATVHLDGNDWRFIREDEIDEIMASELECDSYVLGCFNASFIASVTGWPLALIEAAQKGEQYDAIGQGIIDGGHVEELARKYAAADGYGHHFAHYDGEMKEVSYFCGETRQRVTYYAFNCG